METMARYKGSMDSIEALGFVKMSKSTTTAVSQHVARTTFTNLSKSHKSLVLAQSSPRCFLKLLAALPAQKELVSVSLWQRSEN